MSKMTASRPRGPTRLTEWFGVMEGPFCENQRRLGTSSICERKFNFCFLGKVLAEKQRIREISCDFVDRIMVLAKLTIHEVIRKSTKQVRTWWWSSCDQRRLFASPKSLDSASVPRAPILALVCFLKRRTMTAVSPRFVANRSKRLRKP
jgi:hypothetical protein